MNYRECLEIRKQNEHLIGTSITKDNIQYKVEDLIIFPPDKYSVYLTYYQKSHDFELAVSPFVKETDLNVMMYCTNLETEIIKILHIPDDKDQNQVENH